MRTAYRGAWLLSTAAFDNKTGWKKDDAGNLVLNKDGNPVYVDANGAELALGIDTVARLNGEARDNRIRAEAAEGKLKVFEGITDPAAALQALETVKSISAGDLLKKGEVDKLKEQIQKQFTDQLQTGEKKLTEVQTKLKNMIVSGAFGGSKYIKDQIAVPSDMLQAMFGSRFIEEGDKLVGVDGQGNKLPSRRRIGEMADFDEALEIFVSEYPNKDAILKGGNNSGSGNNGGGGNNGNGKRTVRRADFNKMQPDEQRTVVTAAQKGEVVLAD